MRVVWFSFRTFWASFVAGWRKCRRIWPLSLLCLTVGVALGVLTALLVAEPTPHSVLGSVLANTYRPFAVFGVCFACLLAGIAITYISARWPRRVLFWLYLVCVGYVLGRLAYFAALAGVIGVLSLLVCEVVFTLLALSFVLAHFATMSDVLLYTLRPKYNASFVKAGLRYLLWGTALLFVYIVVLWGLVAAIINVAV